MIGRLSVRGLWLILGALVCAAGCTSSEESSSPPVTGTVVANNAPAPTAAPAAQDDPAEVMAHQRAINEKNRVVSAQRLTAGRAFVEKGQFAEARAEFQDAYALDPTNKEAQREYDAMSAILGLQPTGSTPEQQKIMQDGQAGREQAAVLAKAYFDQGVKARVAGDFARAVSNFEKAAVILRTNVSIDADFNDAQVRAALAQAKEDLAASERSADAERVKQIAEVQRQRDEDDRKKVGARVDALLQEGVNQFSREKFADVQTTCDQVLALDFNNQAAMRLRDEARRAEIELRAGKNIAEHREQWQRVLEEVKAIGVVQTNTVTYASLDKWTIIANRGPILLSTDDTVPSDRDQEITRKLQSTTLRSVDWQDKPLDEALKFIRVSIGENVTVDKVVDEKVPAADRNLALQFNEISAANALKLAVESLKLRYVVQDGRIRITTPEELRKKKMTTFYEIRDLTAKLTNFVAVEMNLNPSGYGAGKGAPPADDPDAGGDDTRSIEAERLIDMIKTTVDKPSWEEDATNKIADKNGTLIVSQTPENHRLIRELLTSMRKSTGVQVEIETRFISVQNNFLQDIGVDLGGLGDNTGGVGLPGRGTAASFDDFGLPGSPSVLGSNNSAGVFYQNGAAKDVRGRTENTFGTALGNPDTLTASGGFSLQSTYLDTTQVEAVLRAVQKSERINEVTAPKLVVANTQRANLTVLTQKAYLKDFDVQIARAAVIADPIVDIIKEGVTLDVRPTVSSDRRFVTLELRPTVATLVRPIRTFTTTLGVGTAVTFEVPELRKQSLKTTVVMPDGATLLIGGLKAYTEQTQDVGVPILKDIPIISFFFSHKGQYTEMKDIIVLLRVKILLSGELEPGVATK